MASRKQTVDRLVRAGISPDFAEALARSGDKVVQDLIRQAAATDLLAGVDARWHLQPDAIFELGLSPVEGWVLAYLVWRAGRSGSTWPSYATLARECRISRRQAIYTVRSLTDRKLIAVHKQSTGSTQAPAANVYRLRFPRRKSTTSGRASARRGGPSARPAPPSAPRAPQPSVDLEPGSSREKVQSTTAGDSVDNGDKSLAAIREGIARIGRPMPKVSPHDLDRERHILGDRHAS